MGVILVLAGFLAHAIKAFAQAVTLGQQQFALLGVQRHGIERFLQLHARFADLFVLKLALLGELDQLFVKPRAAQRQLFCLGFTGRQLGFQFTLGTGFVLQQTTQMFAAVFLLPLLRTQGLQAGFHGFDRGFTLFAFGLQRLDFLAPGEHAALGFTGATYAQEVSTNPVTVATDQALPGTQLPAQGQRLFEAVDRFDLAEPWRQIDLCFDFIQQAARYPHTIAGRAEQAQIPLGETGQIEAAEVIHQHRLQIGAEHGFHRQLPTGLDLQAFGQTRPFGEVVFFQPFGGAGARIERSLLQGFQ